MKCDVFKVTYLLSIWHYMTAVADLVIHVFGEVDNRRKKMYIGDDGNCHGSTDISEPAMKWQGKFT